MPFPVVAGQTNSTSSVSGTSHTLSLPSSIAAGDLILFQARWLSATVPTPPTGYTQLYQIVGGTVNAAGFYKIAAGGETTISVTFDATVGTVRSISHRITGHGSAIEAATNVQLSTANHDPPNLAPSWGVTDNLWLTTASGGSSNYTAVPANYGNSVFDPSTAIGDALIVCARRNLNASSENPGTFTNTSANGLTATIAVRPKNLIAASGGHTFAGTAVTLTKGKRLTAAAGAHTFAGTAVTLKHAWKVAAASGSHTFAGTVVTLKHAWKFAAASGVHTFAGTDVDLRKGQSIAAASGAHTFAGAAVIFTHGYRLVAASGSHTFAGTDVTLKHAWKVGIGAGAHTFQGTDVSLVKPGALVIAADFGAHTFTGTAVTLKHGWRLDADSGAHAFAGTNVTLKHAWKIRVDSGSHTFAGAGISLTVGVPAPIIIRRSGGWEEPRDFAKEAQEDRKKAIERAWALAHGLPDPYAEAESEAEAGEADATPVDLSGLINVLAAVQGEIDRQKIEQFIRQEAAQVDEAMAVLLLA